MKLKKLFFILTQISLLTLFSGNSAHAFIYKCKGPVPSGITASTCSSCHTGNANKSTYNGACDANNRRVMGNSGMANTMPVTGVGMNIRNQQESLSFRDKMEMDRDEDDRDDYKRHDKKDRDHKMKREHKKKDHHKKDRRKKDRDHHDDD